MESININLLESILLSYFLLSLVDLKRNNLKYVYAVIIIGINFTYITLSNLVNLYDMFAPSHMILINACILKVISRCEFFETLFIACVESVYLVVTMGFTLIIFILLDISDGSLLSKIIYFLCAPYLIKCIKQQEIYYSKNVFYLLSGILFGLQYVFGHLISYFRLYASHHNEFITIFTALTLCMGGFLYLLCYVSKLYSDRVSYKMLQLDLSHSKVSSEIYENANIIRHDLLRDYKLIQQHLNASEYDKIGELIQAKIGEIKEGPSLIDCKNKIVRRIVNQALIKANTLGLETICKLNIGEELSIKDYDLNNVLHNILDNAIENCVVNGKIDISIEQDYEFLFIKVSNTIDKTSDLITKKDKKLHGFGLKSISKTVNKYSGMMSISQTNNTFTITVSLILKRKD